MGKVFSGNLLLDTFAVLCQRLLHPKSITPLDCKHQQSMSMVLPALLFLIPHAGGAEYAALLVG